MLLLIYKIINKFIIIFTKIKYVIFRKIKDNEIVHFKKNGLKPWTPGYIEFKNSYIISTLKDNSIMELFYNNQVLPNKFGQNLDERVVEYPWLISRLGNNDPKIVLDAGSALNHDFLVNHNCFKNRKLSILTLHPEEICFYEKGISYIYHDLRDLPYRDEFFDEIISISTIEHIGMNNTMYTKSTEYKEKNYYDHLIAVKEMKRVLKRNGRVLLSIPYGKYVDYEFYIQFNQDMIKKVIETFNPQKYNINYFAYINQQWNISSADEAKDLESFNIHETKYYNKESNKDYDPDFAASCRSVACIEMIK